MNNFTTLRLVPTFITLLAVGVMGTLGVWQLQRLEWKEGLIAKIEEGRTLPPLTTLPASAGEWAALEFRHVKLPGHFPQDAPVFQVVASRDGKGGFNLLRPFVMADGRSILVNRGFMPSAKEYAASPATEKEIYGLARVPATRPSFLPKDDEARNVWFTVNIPDMSAKAGIAAMPLYIDAIGSVTPGVYPAPASGNIVLRNDHLGYAITWFSIALVALVIFILYHRKPVAS